jgi:hypothetical protein
LRTYGNSHNIEMMQHSAIFLACLFLASGCTCGGEKTDDLQQDGAVVEQVNRTARVVFVQGTVRVKRSGFMEWIPADGEMELAIDDKVRTLRDSFVNIEFERGGLLRVGPESLVVVTDLRVEPRNQARRYTFTLMEGKVEAELDSLKKGSSEFRIRTSSAEASVLKREVAFQ